MIRTHGQIRRAFLYVRSQIAGRRVAEPDSYVSSRDINGEPAVSRFQRPFRLNAE